MDITDWLRANIDRLSTVDPAHADYTELEPLRDIVGDARVVGIGESTHRVHEFHQIRDLLTRFLVDELGFTAFVLESGFPEGWAVDDPQRTGITYHMGQCTELRDQMAWLRDHKVRYYGMDIPDSSASARPAIQAILPFLDDVDPDYAAAVRQRLLPLFDYLPTDRTGLAWVAPALQAYLALDAAHRNELTARTNELTERLHALRVPYSADDPNRADIALQCAITARHADAFLANIANAHDRTYRGANVRDAAMADNVEWILQREQRIVIGAANGHLQRWPYRVPPIINEDQIMLGQHLHRALGTDYVVIATTYNGGQEFVHRPIPGGPPGHTTISHEDVAPFTDPNSLDVLMASAGAPLALLDLRKVPPTGPIADRFAEIDATMQSSYRQLVDPLVAFDAIVHVDKVTPWHHVGLARD